MRSLILLLFAFTLQAASDTAEVGSAACAPCHSEIYRKYKTTGMARSSGRTGQGEFREQTGAAVEDRHTGATYTISNAFRMDFVRPSTGVKGSRDLSWFIGSGNVGRSYASSVDGFLFQTPVSYYSTPRRWSLSPGYAGKAEIDVARPIEPACLYCHASRIQHREGTQNGYADPPFLEGGVSCERCHGPGGAHIQAIQSGKPDRLIVNPVKLDRVRRDSVCLQCHLTGAARVARSPAGPFSYRVGDPLSDHLTIFVWSGGNAGERAATDHAEQLSRSRCSLSERLWCGSCHDPHSQPAASERVAFNRKSCLACHQEKPCSLDRQSRARTGDDCVSCHMPKGRSQEGEHVVYTDHSIPRRPGLSTSSGRSALQSFWKTPPPQRDLALAVASLAMSDASLRQQALELLETQAGRTPDDVAMLAQLAQFYDNLGRTKNATALYERVLALDPAHASANANLGIYRMQEGKAEQAVAHWNAAFSRNPALFGPAINLAIYQLNAGDRAGANATLERVLRFHPDLRIARDILAKVRSR